MKFKAALRSCPWRTITPTPQAFLSKWTPCHTPFLTTMRHLSNGRSKFRFENFQTKLRDRYPNISSSQLPSLTMAFVLLHELTAIVPLVLTFIIFQSTGTGEQIISWIKRTCIVKNSETEIQSDSENPTPSISNWLQDFISTAFQEGSSKISRIAIRYGWINAEKIEASADVNVDQVLSMVDSSVVASGLLAYLSVKALFPLRMGLSLYLAPSFARVFRNFFSSFRRIKKT